MSDSQVKKQSNNSKAPSRLVNMSQPTPPAQPVKASISSASTAKPTPPTSTATQPTASTAAHTQNVQFSSAKIKNPKSTKPDYFAEQNKKRAKKEQQAAKIHKRTVIILVIIALICVIVATVLAVIKLRSGPTISDDAGQGSGDANSELVGVQDLNNQVTEVFKPTYTPDGNGNIVVSGDLAAAEATYEAALANPANKDRIDTIYLAQIVFYASLSDNQRVVDIAAKVNPDKLNLSEKIKFYNLTYLAYSALGDKEQADKYYKLTREASSRSNGIGG